MRMVKANGIHLNVVADGPETGTPLVLAHSLGTDHRVWDGLVEQLPPGLRTICYDIRGHGLSDAPPAPYKMADHVADLAGLLDALGVASAVVVGLSIGGMIGQGLAAAHPGKVRALVLVDTGYRIGTDDVWNERIDTARKVGIEALADGVMERWFSAGYRSEQPEQVLGWRNMLTRTPVEGYVGAAISIRDANLETEARRVNTPTLVLCGSADPTTPPDLARATAALIPGAQCTIVDGPAHLLPPEAPAETAKLVTEFLKENALV